MKFKNKKNKNKKRGKGKKGVAKILSVIMIILLALVLIMLIWNLLKALLIKEAEISEIKAELIAEQMDIRGVSPFPTGNFENPETITVSLRRGPGKIKVTNIVIVEEGGAEGDVFSVTDLSGSMCMCKDVDYDDDCCLAGCGNNQEICESCGYICQDMIYDAIAANKIFIDAVLNVEGSRVGLVGYNHVVDDSDFHSLSDNKASLKNTVDNWKAKGYTCICCGINKAVDSLIADSDESRFRSMVVMSDGEANIGCAEQGVTGDLDGDGEADTPKDDAIKAACDAYANYGIVIHAIGFGPLVDKDTLQAIAACSLGEGSYSFSEIDKLVETYGKVAQRIIEHYEESIVKQDHLKVVFYSDEKTWIYKITDFPLPLETKQYPISLLCEGQPCITNIKRIEVYPVKLTESGDEVIGPALDVWEIEED